MDQTPGDEGRENRVVVSAAAAPLEGELELPATARGLVVFPHGSGMRRSPRDSLLARRLRDAGLGTLVLNLLTDEEEQLDARIACFRFDITLLAKRLVAVTGWLFGEPMTRGLRVGYFGSGTGAAAALAAAARASDVGALVMYDGRIDLAERSLGRIVAPTLLLVSGTDQTLLNLNRAGMPQLGTDNRQLVLVPGADPFADEHAAVDEVARHATAWFTAHLPQALGAIPAAATLS
jgi:dienelactone hydrolase